MIVGLTGGIGAGKSTIAEMMKRKGALIIDADEVAREVVCPGSECWKKIVDHFGEQYLFENGQLNRRKLGEVVFSSPEELKVLNKITHSPTAKVISERIAEAKKTSPDRPIILDCPLLLETGMGSLVDIVVVVVASMETRLERLKKQGFSRAEAQARIKAQSSDKERLKEAEYIIENDGSMRELRFKVNQLWKKLS